MWRIKIIAIFVLVIVPISLFGQIGFTIENDNGYMSNAFSNYLTRPDYYSNLDVKINHDWVENVQGLRVYYQGDLNAFKQFTERNFFTHNVGLNYYRYLGEAGHKINAGFSVGERYHTETYKWYEYRQVYTFANIKFILFDQMYAYAGFNLRWRNYRVFDVFSHWQSVLYYRVSRFFDTGTTIIAETDLLTKHYYPSSETSSIPDLPEVVTLGDGTSQQFVVLVRLAQSLTRTTGLSFQTLLRSNLLRTVRYVGTTSGYYYSDEELFDDVYGYHGQEMTLNLKQTLPWKMTLSMGTLLAFKHYDQRLALDLAGEPFPDERLRDDTKWTYWISLNKQFKLAAKWKPVTLTINWYGVNNGSNDPYYDYKSSYFSFGISQKF